MADGKHAEELVKFKDSLLDVATILEKLTPLCKTSEEVVEIVNLALDNEGQLKILMLLVAAKTR